MLTAIKEIKFFLCTAFGDSPNFDSGEIHCKMQSICKGNGTSLVAWGMVGITIINAHNCRHNGVTFLCSMSALQIHAAGVLFIDDTDLMHMDMTFPMPYGSSHINNGINTQLGSLADSYRMSSQTRDKFIYIDWIKIH